jgi:hypothetical protein
MLRKTRVMRNRTGSPVFKSGIYKVYHSPHTLPSEVTLASDQPFPQCERCAVPVEFEFVRSTPDADEFKMTLNELPASDSDEIAS